MLNTFKYKTKYIAVYNWNGAISKAGTLPPKNQYIIKDNETLFRCPSGSFRRVQLGSDGCGIFCRAFLALVENMFDIKFIFFSVSAAK